MDQRQRYALYKLIETARRHTRETNVIILCDLLDKLLPTMNPDYCTRQNIPLATTLPDLLAQRIANAKAYPHEEHTMALLERLNHYFPAGQTLPDKPPADKPPTPDKPPSTSFVQKKATPSGGRPRSLTPSTEAERKRKAREKKKTELEQILKGSERK
jgi:hypothetical protein